jgi:hypothetical protein
VDEAIRTEIDELCHRATAEVRARADAFWAEYEVDRDPVRLAAWFVPRCWREIDYVFMLGEEIRRYGMRFERKHVTALARQLHDEAEHYDAVGRIIERLGGDVPTAPPPSAEEWSAFLWESLERHPLGAIAAWNMSETAATGTLDGIVAAGRRYDLPDVARAYEASSRTRSSTLAWAGSSSTAVPSTRPTWPRCAGRWPGWRRSSSRATWRSTGRSDGCGSAAADRGDHVDPRAGPERGGELGALPVDVHVDVRTEGRAWLAQAVAQSGPALVEPVDGLVHGRGVDVEPPRQIDEERWERRRQVQVGHYDASTATSTEEIPGR